MLAATWARGSGLVVTLPLTGVVGFFSKWVASVFLNLSMVGTQHFTRCVGTRRVVSERLVGFLEGTAGLGWTRGASRAAEGSALSPPRSRANPAPERRRALLWPGWLRPSAERGALGARPPGVSQGGRTVASPTRPPSRQLSSPGSPSSTMAESLVSHPPGLFQKTHPGA